MERREMAGQIARQLELGASDDPRVMLKAQMRLRDMTTGKFGHDVMPDMEHALAAAEIIVSDFPGSLTARCRIMVPEDTLRLLTELGRESALTKTVAHSIADALGRSTYGVEFSAEREALLLDVYLNFPEHLSLVNNPVLRESLLAALIEGSERVAHGFVHSKLLPAIGRLLYEKKMVGQWIVPAAGMVDRHPETLSELIRNRAKEEPVTVDDRIGTDFAAFAALKVVQLKNPPYELSVQSVLVGRDAHVLALFRHAGTLDRLGYGKAIRAVWPEETPL